jgi:hypothetical protein
MKKHKEFWETAAPKDAVHKHLNRKGVKDAKAHARASGRPYPNMVDNITAARAGHTKKAK